MHIQREDADPHTIRSYSGTHITVASVTYEQSVIINRDTIITPWAISSVKELDAERLLPLLTLTPEIILIGHHEQATPLPIKVMVTLSKQRIGIECMSIGAACRTFNVLLAEGRRVAIGLIYKRFV